MSIAKEHRWLLLAVCAAQFFMPFMVAGVNAVLPPPVSYTHLTLPTIIAV